jgi:hypothetical protein
MLVQITPSWPPTIGGVGDYAALLEQGLRQLGVESRAYVPPYQVGHLCKPTIKSDVLRHLALSKASTVLLHFSGYGYGEHGGCDQLVTALVEWRNAGSARRLIVIFHEVHVDRGPIWRRGFWLFGPQCRIADQLVRVSDRRVVTSIRGAQQLARLGFPTNVWPVFSNVGEPNEILKLDRRKPRAVVFGMERLRESTIRKVANNSRIVRWLQENSIEEITSIGPGVVSIKYKGGIPIKSKGELRAQEVSALMSSARIGLVDYHPNSIGKSGVIAAYLAHGMLVLNAHAHTTDAAQPTLDDCLLTPIQLNEAQIDVQQIADAGLDWYRQHSVAATCAMVAELDC